MSNFLYPIYCRLSRIYTYLYPEGGGERERTEVLGTDCTHVRVTYYQDYFTGGREQLGAVISYGRVIKYYITPSKGKKYFVFFSLRRRTFLP